jgi:hypothetical protein
MTIIHVIITADQIDFPGVKRFAYEDYSIHQGKKLA